MEDVSMTTGREGCWTRRHNPDQVLLKAYEEEGCGSLTWLWDHARNCDCRVP